jgi:hypothetical protein
MNVHLGGSAFQKRTGWKQGVSCLAGLKRTMRRSVIVLWNSFGRYWAILPWFAITPNDQVLNGPALKPKIDQASAAPAIIAGSEGNPRLTLKPQSSSRATEWT